jgi:hypothetical protein
VQRLDGTDMMMNRGIPFVRSDFDMVKHGFIDRTPHSWLSSTAEGSEWPRYDLLAPSLSTSLNYKACAKLVTGQTSLS